MPFDEISEGANYLSALKRSSTPQAAAKARTVKAESRRSPRYRCQGSVRLQQEADGAPSWATFSDISMHGCYVEAASPLSVGTVMDLQLQVDAYRVEATGEVSVSYPNLGMGISFIKMSEEDRERLRELVRSISQPSVIVGARLEDKTRAKFLADVAPAVPDPAVALQAMRTFFEDRHMMGREEFLKILRKSQ
jgi:PilZ domain-containing protein